MTSRPLAVLGIGASGSETVGLQRVLTGLPDDAGLSTVLAFQNREALDEADFRRALGKRAGALAPAVDGASLEPGRIYLSDAGVIVTVEGGQLRTRQADEQPGGRATIDSLFVALAEEDGYAIALVLAGTGGDGTLGVAAIKEAGGFTLAEAEADLDPLKLAASNHPAALADLILPIDELAGRIALHAHHLAQHRAAAAEMQAAGAEVGAALSQIAAVLRQRTGHDFHGYKRATFLRRVQRRMGVLGIATFDAYLDALQTRRDETQLLFNDLLIGVTRFFRDAREFEFLEREVVPRLFESKGRGDQIRVWVLGCSTGEEAYSVAILLREFAAGLDGPPAVQIFATDLDGRALASARAGRYKRDIAQDVSAHRLARWFVEEGDTYAVRRELRDMCVFSQHSLVKDTPFSRLDMVSCRNLLIYLGPELQDRVIPLFHFALKPSGYLFLGASEGLARHAGLFAPVDRGVHIFRKLETGRRVLPDFPVHPALRGPAEIAVRSAVGPADAGLVRRAEQLAERHAPNYAVVDRRFDVLHLSPRVGRFIHPVGGAFSPNLLDLVHADLRLDLRGALSKAAADGAPVRVDKVRMGTEGQDVAVDLVVEPVPDGSAHGAGSAAGFVVLFRDGQALSEASEPVPGGAELAEHVNRLEADLRLTRQRLQATIEELEGANEELRSSNEEFQSLNEELQSANEELATSKEELQSLNEELTTVNHELAYRVDELGRVNSTLKNLLQATRIATLFLDGALRVTNFTPAAEEVFHLTAADYGRPITHIKSRVSYEDLQSDVLQVLRTLHAVEREVTSPATGARYMVRVLPYRNTDNVIAGTVVTFTDITQLVDAQDALRSSERRLRLVTESIPQFVWTAARSGDWTWAGPQWTEYTGQSQADSRGLGWLSLIHPEDRPALEAAWAAAPASGTLDVIGRVRSAAGTYRWFHTRATQLAPAPDGGDLEWFGTSTDVHEMHELRERQGVLVAELQHRTRNLLAVVRSLADKTVTGSASLDDFHAMFRDRLSALSRVQGLLSRLAVGEQITFDTLIRTELTAVGALDAQGRGPQVILAGPEQVWLQSTMVQIFALALHELATNAIKFGALSNNAGRLSVTWTLAPAHDGQQVLHVLWLESGVTLPELEQGTVRRRGYGRELIEQALPYQLHANTTYELGPEGVRCTIELPVTGTPGD